MLLLEEAPAILFHRIEFASRAQQQQSGKFSFFVSPLDANSYLADVSRLLPNILSRDSRRGSQPCHNFSCTDTHTQEMSILSGIFRIQYKKITKIHNIWTSIVNTLTVTPHTHNRQRHSHSSTHTHTPRHMDTHRQEICSEVMRFRKSEIWQV